MKLLFRFVSLNLLAVAFCLAGCGGNNNTFRGPCSPPNGTQTVLVYPAPGATAVPDAFGLVILGSTSPLPASFDAFVMNNTTGNGVFFNQVTNSPPSPLPTPNAVPPFANPVFKPSGNPGATFVSGSSITVFLNNTNSFCHPASLGSFTVQ